MFLNLKNINFVIHPKYPICPMSRLEKTILFPILLGVIFLGACSNNLWDEVPTPIASFIEQYFLAAV